MSHSTSSGQGPSKGSGGNRCRDLDPLFTSYVDNEATPHERAVVDAHLTACPPCRDRVAGERTARTVVQARRDKLRICASPSLHGRCAALRAGTPVHRSAAATLTRRWVPLSLAATLVLAIAGVFLVGLSDRVEVFAAQLALDHVKCFKFTPDRLAVADAAALGRDWAVKRGWALTVPPSAPAHQLELLGVRRCGSTEGGLAHVMYRWRGEPLSVYVLPGSIAPEHAVQNVADRFGHDAVVWSREGRTYAVVAKASPADLVGVAGYIKTAAH
jgi:anti-sigma factor RsiW